MRFASLNGYRLRVWFEIVYTLKSPNSMHNAHTMYMCMCKKRQLGPINSNLVFHSMKRIWCFVCICNRTIPFGYHKQVYSITQHTVFKFMSMHFQLQLTSFFYTVIIKFDIQHTKLFIKEKCNTLYSSFRRKEIELIIYFCDSISIFFWKKKDVVLFAIDLICTNTNNWFFLCGVVFFSRWNFNFFVICWHFRFSAFTWTIDCLCCCRCCHRWSDLFSNV